MSNGSYEDSSGGDDRLSQENDALRRDVEQLRIAVSQLAQANALEHVVNNGFHELIALFKPLEVLKPIREDLDPKAARDLQRIVDAIRHPRWSGSEFHVVARRERPVQGSQA